MPAEIDSTGAVSERYREGVLQLSQVDPSLPHPQSVLPSEIKSHSFRLAELRSECARAKALLFVLAGLLALVLVRGLLSLFHGYRGDAWRSSCYCAERL